MSAFCRRSSIIGVLLCGTSLAFPTHAQSSSAGTSFPQRYQVDANHVDRITGSVVFANRELTLGQGADNSLSLVDYFGAGSAAPSGNNWNMVVYSLFAGNTLVLDGTGTTKKFLKSGNTYTPQSADAGTLLQSGSGYIYYSPDGTKIIYDYVLANQGTAYATRVVHPNGFTALLTYSSVAVPGTSGQSTDVRLQAVSSNTGYQLHFGYQTDTYDQTNLGGTNYYGVKWHNLTDVKGLNGAIDYCDPSAGHCGTLTQSAPTVLYSATGNLLNGDTLVSVSIDDPRGLTTTYSRNYASNTVSVQTPGRSTPNYVYKFDGDTSAFLLGTAKLQQATINGASYAYSISVSGASTSITETDPLGHSNVTVANQSIQQITSRTDGNGHVTSYQYNGSGYLSKTILAEGNSIEYTRDSRGNETTTTYHSKPGSGLADITTSASYPASCDNPVTCNQPTSRTDARGNVTTYTYDPNSGEIATATESAVGGISPQTRYSYTSLQAYYKNSSGSVVASGMPIYQQTAISACRTTSGCSGGADETKMTVSFGPQAAGTANNLLPVSVTAAAGDGSLSTTASATYDAVGNPFTSTDALGHVTRYRYDADRELVGVVTADPDGASALHNRARRITYNADGLTTLVEAGYVVSQSDADWANFVNLNQVSTTYDSADREIEDRASESTSVLSVTQYSYDAASRLDCTVVRMNYNAFPAAGAVSACTQGTAGSFGPDRISENHYDAASQLTSATSGVGTALLRTDASYAYNPNGTVSSLTDAKGNVTSYGYDGFDRPTTTTYPKPGGGDFEQLGYDPNGNVTSRRLRDGNSIGYGYDVLNRRTSMTLPATGQVSDSNVTYSYDLLGHLLQANDTNGHFAHYTYDALGRQLTEASPWGTKTSVWNLNGDRTRLTWPDGFFVNYFYNNLDEMVGIQENGSTFVAAFDYDDLGRRIRRHLGAGGDISLTTYGYIGMSRLGTLSLAGSAANPATITLGNYSPANDLGSRVNSNDAFAWTQGVNVNRGYTPNSLNQYASVAGGGLSYDARGNLTSSGGTSYAYNSKNQLASSGANGYYYDPLGRLDQSWAEGLSFDYDGQDMISEVNSSNQIVRRYIFGPGGDEPIIWYEGSGTTDRRYLDHDERGSITRISKQDGTTLAINSYDEYGIPASTNQGRFQYTGQAWMPGIGMYSYKARVYSPTFGRFLQTDPIGYGNGPSWYNYTGSNPINRTDPLGTAFVCIGIPGSSYYDEDSNEIVDTGNSDVDCFDDGTDTPQSSSLPGGVPIGSPGTSPINVVARRSPQDNGCGSGPRLVLGRSFGGTMFGGGGDGLGGSASVGIGLSVPLNFLRTGSLAGTQIYVSGTLTDLDRGLETV